MADEPDNLVLVMLRRLDAKVDALGADMRDLKARMTAVEDMFAFLVKAIVNLQHAMDRHGERLERIEKRLGLVDEPAK
jgi:hypothetical protein